VQTSCGPYKQNKLQSQSVYQGPSNDWYKTHQTAFHLLGDCISKIYRYRNSGWDWLTGGIYYLLDNLDPLLVYPGGVDCLVYISYRI
jgi:hypothetical protein